MITDGVERMVAFSFSVPFSFAGEKVRFRAENSAIWE